MDALSLSPTRLRRRWALGLAAVGAAAGAVAGAWLLTASIGRSTSSTAAFSFIELPFAMLVWATPCAVMGFCAGYLIGARRLGGRLFPALLATLVLLGIAVPSLAYIIGTQAIAREVGRVASMDEKALEGVVASERFGTNPFVLAAVAENPHAGTALLHEIAIRPDPRLHEKLWSYFDVMGSNRKGLAVLRLVARHPNVDGETLELLANSDNSYVRSDVALSPKVSEQTLRRLGQEPDPLMQWAIARNPKAVLVQLSLSADESVRSSVASNPSASPDILARLASDPVFHVRRGVASNPNTSPEVRETLRHDPDPRMRAVFPSR